MNDVTYDGAYKMDAWDPGRGSETKPWRPLPLVIEDVTAEWLTSALSSRAPGLVVNSREITRVKHGFTSLIFVTMDINEAGRKAGVPARIVIKGGFTPHSRKPMYAYGYCMEALSYRDVWPALSLKMPTCYFVDMDLDALQSIIIMEDLNDRGVKWGHGLRPIGYEMMRERIGMIAKLHSETWGKPILDDGGPFDGVLRNGARLSRINMEENGWIVPSEDQTRLADFVQEPHFYTPEGWPTLWEERITQNAVVPVKFRDMAWSQRAIRYLEKLSEELPNVIVHGDTHLGNHYEEDGKPGFFDPMPRREPAYFELAYTITTGLDPCDRRSWERSLIGHYVNELARHGVNIDFDETVYYYALFIYIGFLWFIVNDTMWQTPAFNTVNVWRIVSTMVDNNTKELFDAAFAAER